MDEKKRLIKNSGIIAIGNLSTKVITFFLLPLYTTVLSTEEYGTIDYIAAIAGMCAPFVSMLLNEAMFRFLIDCRSKEDRKQIITIAVMMMSFGMIVFTGLAGLFVIMTGYRYGLFFILYVLAYALTSLMNSLLRGLGKTSSYAVFNFEISISTLFLNILFVAILYWGVRGMLLSTIIAHFIWLLVYSYKEKVLQYIKFSKFNKTIAVDMIKYSVPLIPNKLSWTIINTSDRIIIKNCIGASASGLYAVSYKFPNMMDTIYGFFYQSWKESSARSMHEEDWDSFYNTIYDYLKRFMFAVVLLMISFMPLVFQILVNKKFYNAILYVPILLFSTYFSNMSGFYGGIFSAFKDTKLMGWTTIVAAIINIIINFALILKIGLWAAAVSTLIANVVVYFYRRKKLRKYIELKENLPLTCISWTIGIVVCAAFYSSQLLWMFFAAAISVAFGFIINSKLLMGTYSLLISKVQRTRF